MVYDKILFICQFSLTNCGDMLQNWRPNKAIKNFILLHKYFETSVNILS